MMRWGRLLTTDQRRLLHHGDTTGAIARRALMTPITTSVIGAALDELRMMQSWRRLWAKLMYHVDHDAFEHVADHLTFNTIDRATF